MATNIEWTDATWNPTVGYTLKDRKGGDPSEWPEDLRVREFPTAVRGGVC